MEKKQQFKISEEYMQNFAAWRLSKHYFLLFGFMFALSLMYLNYLVMIMSFIALTLAFWTKEQLKSKLFN